MAMASRVRTCSHPTPRSGTAPDANAVEERPASTNDGADVEVDVPQDPESAPKVGVTAEERGALDGYAGIMQPVGDGLIRVGDLVHVPSSSMRAGSLTSRIQWCPLAILPRRCGRARNPHPRSQISTAATGTPEPAGAASHDITGGLDTGDGALVNEAAAPIGHVNEVIDQAWVLIGELVAERGG